MSSYFLTISYCGTGYFGWQSQEQQNVPTIQAALVEAFEKVFNVTVLKIVASGRTDRGVHAINQYVGVTLSRDIPEESMVRALNAVLPSVICLKAAVKTSEFVHPLANILSKHYVYLFSQKDVRPFSSDRILQISDNCDIEKMVSAAKVFVGRFDFSDFKCQGTETSTNIRTIQECHILPFQDFIHKDHFSINSSNVWCLSIKADGFLKQMVRMIMGALLAVSRGAVTEQQLRDALAQAPVGKRFGKVAEAHGLYLYDSEYSPRSTPIN